MSGKPYERLNLDNSASSYADLHHEITTSVENGPSKSYGNHQKQGNCRRESNEDELIRYMSNLPGYLEKGESTDEKVLNVGVLDWACLEQWQYSHQHMPHISSRSSISTSNTSLSVSKDRSSGCSSKGRSLSPSCQRICHPSLQSHFVAFGMQGHSRDAKSSLKCIEKCQTLRGSQSNINIHSQFVRANGHLSQNLLDSRLKSCNWKDLNPKIDMKRAVLSNDKMYEATLCTKSKKSPQEGEHERRVETSQPSNMDTVEQDVLRKNKPLVFRLPRDIPQDGHSGVSDMRTSQGQKSRVPFQVKGCSSIDAESIKVPTATFSASLSAKMRISPCRSRETETKQTTPTILYAKGPTLGLNQKVASEKPRSSSPFRRFSFSTGFTSKGSSCKEDAFLPHMNSVGTSSGNMRGCSSSDISGNGKAGDVGRNRSSPLRRLLDPLLKPKAVNSRHSAESSQNNSLLINKNCMSANGKSSTLQLEKELITNHGVGCSTVCTDSSKNEKLKSSTVQALLSIAVKNGLPLFTFAIDKNSNILAATVKKLGTSEKDDCSCIYTFFTFREVNRKNGNWMKQAGKCKGTDYIHHVVAQMEVSNPRFFYLTGQNYVDSSTLKEFVLYSMKLNQGGDQATDYQPNDELAAIILKIPKSTNFINVHQSSSCNDGQEFVRATVVLPSGIHSHPSKGGPSSLIERWKSGGSCDCGGWDMGCELKILGNENLAAKKSSSSIAHAEDHFELYFQGNGREHRPALSCVPFERGIFSVVYDSSLSLLQAFSISIALVDGKMPRELSGSRNSVERKPPRVQIDGIKGFQ